MSILQKILTYSAHARDEVRRANDPETHQPFPMKYEPGVIVKLGAWLLETPWGARVIMRVIAAASGSAFTWLTAHGAGTHTEKIVTGLGALLTFLSEILISWLNKKAGKGVTPLESARSYAPAYLLPEAEDDPRPSLFVGANRDKPLLKKLAEPEVFGDAPTERIKIPGRIPFPSVEQIAEEITPALDRIPPAPAPEEKKFYVEYREHRGQPKTKSFDTWDEAREWRDEKRLAGFIVKLLPLCIAFLLVGCAVDPATGKKRYAGPNVSFSAGYHGISAGVTLWGFYGEEKKPSAPLPVTAEVMGIPLNTK